MMKTKRSSLACAVAALAAGGPIQGAVLTSVPMQGSMIHANIAYEAAQNRLTATVETPVPRLLPLDVSHPADDFAPGDPWFECLDPSRDGLAFNRQYGFVLTGDAPPAPLSVWIRHLSGTPNLAFYRYRSGANKGWDPMFSTGDSTNLLEWSMLMFHPAVAAPPASGTHSAVFEAFLANTETGLAVPGVSPAQFTLNWTIVPSARELHLGNDGILWWGAPATNYVAEWTDTLPSAGWNQVQGTPVVQDGRCLLPVDRPPGQRFYRLRRVP